MNDFATEEYVNKNCRVRPVSSMSGGKKNNESEHNAKSGIGAGQKNEDEEELKFSEDTLHDLKMMRMEQKEKFRKQEELKLMELEKAEKKRK